MARPTMTPARIFGVASTAVVAAALALLTPTTVAPAAQAGPCPDVEVVFARGTSEPAGIGRVGQALTDSLEAQLGGRTVSTYAVNYPASYDFLGAADGAADATNHILATSAACPSTRFVLGGYSQGAAVVDMLVGIPPLGNKVGDIGSAPPLPSSLANKVAGAGGLRQPRHQVRQSHLGGRRDHSPARASTCATTVIRSARAAAIRSRTPITRAAPRLRKPPASSPGLL